MSAGTRHVNITRSPIGIPCPVKVRPGTPDAEADESERTELCAVNAQWLIGSQWCCDVHMLKVCDLLALDFCGIADEAGVPASVYDRPWADRQRADQGEAEKYQRDWREYGAAMNLPHARPDGASRPIPKEAGS